MMAEKYLLVKEEAWFTDRKNTEMQINRMD